jgi:putative ABC transport system ATP-binding protein
MTQGLQPPLVRLEGVSRVFDSGAVIALSDVYLSIAKGECLAIVGPSGSGKSSLVNLLSGFDTASSGSVHWDGCAVRSRGAWTALRARHIGIIFQEFNLLPTLSAAENVEMPMFGSGIPSPERRQRAMESLKKVGLQDRLRHLPHQLSGGERQRVAIARSIVNRPSLLLADEPTGNLDRANAQRVADLLFGICGTERAALVLVTHNEQLARRCQRIVRLEDGKIIDDRPSDLTDGSRAAAIP